MKILIKNANIPDLKKRKINYYNLIIENEIITDIFASNINISNYKEFNQIIDATNYLTTAGFIDVHSHSDLQALNTFEISPKILQGITTEIVGNCGLSVAPVSKKNRNAWRRLYKSIWGNEHINWNWTDTKSYLEIVNTVADNTIETLIGYSTIRFNVTGLSSKKLTNDELKKIEYIICENLEQGACGVSLGIGYPPNIYAAKEEYILIGKLLKKYDKILTAHIRDEGDNVIAALEEIFEYSIKTGCKTHISHLKSYGQRNWHKTEKIIELIDKLEKKIDITFDSYPYTAGSTTLNSLLPPDLLELKRGILKNKLKTLKTREYIHTAITNGLDGWENYASVVGFENIAIVGLTSAKFKKFEGQRLIEISQQLKQSVIDTLCDILISENFGASMIMHSMSEPNVIKLFKHKKQMVGSDGLFSAKPHPRTYGAFPRVISRFCNELKTIDIYDAIYKMTEFPALRFNLKNCGFLQKNQRADILIFDSKKIKDTADYDNPKQSPVGIFKIIARGKVLK